MEVLSGYDKMEVMQVLRFFEMKIVRHANVPTDEYPIRQNFFNILFTDIHLFFYSEFTILV